MARVIGDVTLSRRLPDVPPGRFLVVQPQPLAEVAQSSSVTPPQASSSSRAARPEAAPAASVEPLVAYDELSAGRSAKVGVTEGREAAMPFHPRPVPIDAYCVAILDAVHVDQSVKV